jgi:crotonobetaine/carnitine-CoA ligase
MTIDNRGFLDLLHERCETMPEAEFMRFGRRTLTFAELERSSRAVAAALKRKGLAAGDRIALMMANRPEVPALLYGLARSGLVWVPVNPEQRGLGLKYLIEHSSPRVILVDEDKISNLTQCGADLGQTGIISFGGTNETIGDLLGAQGEWSDHPTDAATLFAIMYTSGTTGHPKGVLVSHGMMRFAAEAAALLADARDGDRLHMWEPMYHVGGAQVMLLPLLRRLSIELVEKLSVSHFWEQVQTLGCTHIHYLGGILQMLLTRPASDIDRKHGARVGWGAGARADNWNTIQERFGISLREAYGMTETASIATFNGDGTPGSVGRPVPWFKVEVLDEAGSPVPPHARGEIVVTPTVPHALFSGYFLNEEATRSALRGGRMFTNDIGSFDEAGRLFFHGRKTDSIRCRGENVSAMEVEQVVALHPAIADSAAVGVEAEIGEQEIKLFIELKPGSVVSETELSAWLSQRLAPYQNPRYIAFVSGFERTPSERIMKHKLDKSLAATWDRNEGLKRQVSLNAGAAR